MFSVRAVSSMLLPIVRRVRTGQVYNSLSLDEVRAPGGGSSTNIISRAGQV